MKTLKEQVEEIKNMRGSKATKKAAFIKLGLRKYEVELLMAEMPKTIRETHKFTFGVEIECLVAANIMRECATRNAMPFRYEGYNMKTIITIISLFLILLSEVKILSNVFHLFLQVKLV